MTKHKTTSRRDDIWPEPVQNSQGEAKQQWEREKPKAGRCTPIEGNFLTLLRMIRKLTPVSRMRY